MVPLIVSVVTFPPFLTNNGDGFISIPFLFLLWFRTSMSFPSSEKYFSWPSIVRVFEGSPNPSEELHILACLSAHKSAFTDIRQ